MFREALGRKIYSELLSKGSNILEVHGLSPGAAVLAVRWWLADVVSARAYDVRVGCQLTITTGWGQAEEDLAGEGRQAFAVQLLLGAIGLQELGHTSPGCVKVRLEPEDLVRLRGVFASAD